MACLQGALGGAPTHTCSRVPGSVPQAAMAMLKVCVDGLTPAARSSSNAMSARSPCLITHSIRPVRHELTSNLSANCKSG